MKKILLVCILVLIVVGIFYTVFPYIRNQIRRAQYKPQTFTGRVIVTESVSITNCFVDPVIAYAYPNSNIRFINNDSRAHALFFREGKYIVPANDSADVPVGTITTFHNKSYDCDSRKNAGAISLIQAASTSTNQTASTTRR